MDVLTEAKVVVPAVVEELPAVHAALERFWKAVDSTGEDAPGLTARLNFATAVVEIATNIVRYAYPAAVPRGDVCLRLRLYYNRVEARLSDRGIRYTPSSPSELPELDETDLPEGGFGLALAALALDHLQYRRTPTGTNCWRLVKRFSKD